MLATTADAEPQGPSLESEPPPKRRDETVTPAQLEN